MVVPTPGAAEELREVVSADEFRLPDWEADLDTERYIRAAPEDGWVRGMFFKEIARRVRDKQGGDEDPYVGFKRYPLKDYLRFLVESAEILHPDVSLRRGLRALGHLAYPTFVASTVGKILFSVATNWVGALRIASKAFTIAVRPGRVRVRELDVRTAIVELRNMYSFAPAYQVGLFEGAMAAFDRAGEVRYRELALHEVDLRLTWEPFVP